MRNIAAFPLAIPLMAGPGAITATILLAGQAGGRAVLARGPARRHRGRGRGLSRHLPGRASGSASCSAITGNVVLSRLLGVILAALAVQYVIDGVRAVFAG